MAVYSERVVRMDYQCKKADKLWGKVMHTLSSHCAMCGCYSTLEAHHIIHRHMKATRHSVWNGILLCNQCHLKAHRNPKQLISWLERNRPEQYRFVMEHRNKIEKPDYEGAIRELKEIIQAPPIRFFAAQSA